MTSLGALASALDALLLSGPAALPPLERRAALALDRPLPPNAAAARERLCSEGSPRACLDLAAWCAGALASRSEPAVASGALCELMVARTDQEPPLASRPYPRWLSAIASDDARESHNALELLLAQEPAWIAQELLATRSPADPHEQRWIARWIARVVPRGAVSEVLLRWVCDEPAVEPALRSSIVCALARGEGLDDPPRRERFVAIVRELAVDASEASDAVSAMVDHEAPWLLDALGAWLDRGVLLRRAPVERALRALHGRTDEPWRRWLSARLGGGLASSWEVELLERLSRR